MKQKIILLIGLIITLISCKPSDNILHKTSAIFKIEAPDSGKVNDSVKVEVYFKGINSCTGFSKFYESKSNFFSRTISVVTFQNGSNCYSNIPILHQTYQFIPKQKGLYTLRFLSDDNTFITKEISIN